MWSDPSPSDNSEDEAEPTPLEVYNKAISQIAASGTGSESPDPLTFQLKRSWNEISQFEKEACVEKATEACQLICDFIAPNCG